MLLDWEEEVFTEDGKAIRALMTGARSDEVIEAVSTGVVVDDSAGVIDAAIRELVTGAGSDEVVEAVSTGVVVDNCAGVLEAGLAEGSGACEDWTGIALTSCFCWTATDGRDGAILVAVEVAVGVAMAPVLDDEHSEGASLSLLHSKVPSSIPLQTSFWPTSLPLRTKATTVGPAISTVLKTSAARLA